MNTALRGIFNRRRVLPEASGLLAIVALVALGAAAIHAQPQKNKKNPPAKGALVADKGEFKILLGGQLVGREEFEIAPSGDAWLAHGTTEIHAPGAASSHVKSAFRLLPSGAPQKYELFVEGERKAEATVDFQSGVAKTTRKIGSAIPFQQDVTFGTPMVTVLDNNLYHHYAILARIYDWNKRGAQTFPVLIPQDDMTPGVITVEAGAPENVAGKSFETLKVTTADLEVHLFLDAHHRLMRLEVPASKVVVTRE
jgi:hypothetical protein